MIEYLVDTDICIYIKKHHPPQVRARLNRVRPGRIGMSLITHCELRFGAYKSSQRQQALEVVERLSAMFPVQPLTVQVAGFYASIRHDLEKRGMPIGANDLIIAAHALSLNATLITNNSREFSRVPGLRVENWVK